MYPIKDKLFITGVAHEIPEPFKPINPPQFIHTSILI